MALNLKDSLDIVKRAGFGPHDTMRSPDAEQRLAERLRRLEQDPYCEYRDRDPLRATGSDSLRTVEDLIDHHYKNTENLSVEELFDINDL